MSRRLFALLALMSALPFLLICPFVSSQEKKLDTGKRIKGFTLTDPRSSQRVSLDDFQDKKAVVIVFLGTECPINNAYAPTLVELAKTFTPQGVQFLAINSNRQDSADTVAAHAKKNSLPFPVLKDPDNTVADLLGAQRTPEAFLLDADRTIRYRGRIDDQIGVGFVRPKPTRQDLAVAIREVLTGKPVSKPSTSAPGCYIARKLKPKDHGTVTFSRDVASILQKNCQECHRPGQIGPMALLTYDDAVAWSETIREVVQEKRMPPWDPDPKYGVFENDRRLSDQERATLLAWIDQGCPPGDIKDLPVPRDFPTGWSIGKPDKIIQMTEEFTVPAVAPKTGIPYQHFTIDPHFDEDMWVVRAEARPGVASVVHHILVYVVLPGEKFDPNQPNRVLCGVAPGDIALILPPGLGKQIPKGSKLVFQMHYTPNGTPQKDRSSVGLIFAKKPPENEAFTVGVANHEFVIPAENGNYQVESSFTFERDGHILGFMPHMHLRGKDFVYEAIHPDGKKEILLSVPRYNFGWQASYRLAKPYPMPKGSKLHCVAHFDNSSRNPNNPDPKQDVHWGDQTWEEMMIGWTEMVFDKK